MNLLELLAPRASGENAGPHSVAAAGFAELLAGWLASPADADPEALAELLEGDGDDAASPPIDTDAADELALDVLPDWLAALAIMGRPAALAAALPENDDLVEALEAAGVDLDADADGEEQTATRAPVIDGATRVGRGMPEPDADVDAEGGESSSVGRGRGMPEPDADVDAEGGESSSVGRGRGMPEPQADVDVEGGESSSVGRGRGMPEPQAAVASERLRDALGTRAAEAATRASGSRQISADLGAAPGTPSAAPAAATAAEAPTPQMPGSSLAERVARIAEQLEHAPPPRRMTVELGDLRVTVSLRGDSVHVATADGEALHPSWQRELQAALAARGMSLGSGQSGERRDQRDADDPEQRGEPATAPRTKPSTGRPRDGLRL